MYRKHLLKIKLLQYHFEMVRCNMTHLAIRLIVCNILCSANSTGNADEQTPLVLVRTSTATITTVWYMHVISKLSNILSWSCVPSAKELEACTGWIFSFTHRDTNPCKFYSHNVSEVPWLVPEWSAGCMLSNFDTTYKEELEPNKWNLMSQMTFVSPCTW